MGGATASIPIQFKCLNFKLVTKVDKLEFSKLIQLMEIGLGFPISTVDNHQLPENYVINIMHTSGSLEDNSQRTNLRIFCKSLGKIIVIQGIDYGMQIFNAERDEKSNFIDGISSSEMPYVGRLDKALKYVDKLLELGCVKLREPLE